jgi:bifunctional UDP-N-acetylglucosamine pyrophosphorylase/glucosamine-1-phosphate N-acetyltransferase
MAAKPAEPACATRHAVILAAGESKRTRPLTSHRPKPLIPLLGRPLLAHILDELVGLVERATLVVGYMADTVEAGLGASYRGIALRYVRQREVNGTAGALLAAGPIDEPFFLLYGDNLIARADVLGVCDEPYKLAGLRVEDARSFGVLQLAGGRVTGIWEKPPAPPPDALANPGIFHFGPAAMALAAQIRPSPRGELELTDLIGLLAAERPVGHHICVGHWVPVGTPWEALSAAQFLLARRAGLRPQIDPTAAIAADASLAGAVTLGPGARIGAGARLIGPAVIAAGCVVGAGARVERSALEAGAQVGERAELRDSVLGAGARIGAAAFAASSWLDDGAVLAPGAALPAREHEELRPTAETTGLLSRAALRTRGAVLGRGARVEGTAEPGSVVIG